MQLGKLIPLYQHPDEAPKQKLWQAWLGYLPMKRDKIEAKVVHKELCALTDYFVKMPGAKAHVSAIMLFVWLVCDFFGRVLFLAKLG